ncbi:hypothetical protein PENSPDRAFT_669456 [Peniophora sp. CONT]|nr:hypothetical protein PENSPDRAFT_669456 [Peniophora sp. CONT]
MRLLLLGPLWSLNGCKLRFIVCAMVQDGLWGPDAVCGSFAVLRKDSRNFQQLKCRLNHRLISWQDTSGIMEVTRECGQITLKGRAVVTLARRMCEKLEVKEVSLLSNDAGHYEYSTSTLYGELVLTVKCVLTPGALISAFGGS